MRVAEDVVMHGMTSSGAFNKALTALVANRGITKVIETGTYLGEGTTKAIIEGLQAHGKPFKFFSLEVNPSNYAKAVMNVGKVEGVFLLNVLSINKTDLPKVVEFTDYPEDVIVDYQEKVRSNSYVSEVSYNVKDEGLYECLKALDCEPELVVLDSAGHIGLKEFDELMKYVKGEFFLALDDINHVKHYKTVQKIKDDERFTIIWETSDKFGSLLAKVKMD